MYSGIILLIKWLVDGGSQSSHYWGDSLQKTKKNRLDDPYSNELVLETSVLTHLNIDTHLYI